MADIVVRAPDGAIVEVPEEDYQTALDAGYQNVSADEARAAREQFVGAQGEQAGVSAGVLSAPDEVYSPGREALAKVVSAATFGLGGLSDPTSRLTGQRFQEEHPGYAMAAEVAGQLPLAIATGGAGEAAVAGAAGLTRLARVGVAAADFGAQAAVGGAQTEAERVRLSGEEFSATNAAVAGLVGEAFGRTAGLGFSKALGASRNLIERAADRAVAQDTSDALSRGGFLNDFRVAAHADRYQNELAKLAADDLDQLETNFAEVSRQDRKRARIARVVEDRPAEQTAIRAQTLSEMQGLYEALYTEIGEGAAPGPARQMLDQLRKRMDLLEAKPTGARLWRTLDENRQALQDYAQDLHQAYETAPGSAWLSREALGRLDATERATREALLREDAWGQTAAREQAAYNQPFHEKYFPTAKTVRGKLMFETARDARGFPVYRGDPGRVRAFFTRGAGDVDSARLSEQFREYLDGVEAIARAGERDTPRAARDTLESVRRLRKALAHAEFVQHTAERMGRRADVVEVGVGVGAGLAGAAAGGLPGAVAGGVAAQTVRGLRTVHWLSQAARKLGWAGSPESMARLLSKGELPRQFGPDTPADGFLDDLVVTPRGSEPPPSGGAGPSSAPPGGGVPGVPPAPSGGPGGAGGRGLTPSMLADARRGSWAPSAPPGTMADELGPEPSADPLSDLGRPGRAERAARETMPIEGREVGRGQQERLELDLLRDARGPAQREARRLEALSEGEFRDIVQQLEAASPEAAAFAARLRASLPALKSAGLVTAAGVAGSALADDPEGGALAAGAAGLGLALGKKGLGFRKMRAEVLKLKKLGLSDEAIASRLGEGAVNYAQEWAERLGLPASAVTDGRNIMVKRVGDAEGSNPGGWYETRGGQRYYVKTYDDPEQAMTEVAVNRVYRMPELAMAPRSRLITTPEGDLAYAAADMKAEGWRSKALGEVTVAEAREFARGFWYDVLLANWDVVGQTGDNLLFNSSGRVMRIDNGSSIAFRAMGSRKPPGALASLSEIDGFFNPQLNPSYSQLLRKAGIASPKDLRPELSDALRRFENGALMTELDQVLPASTVSVIWERLQLLKAYADRLEPPGERMLRENLGASQRLGAMFRTKPEQAEQVVQRARERLAPPPPPDSVSTTITPWLDDAGTPGLTELVKVSKRAAQALDPAERDALGEWVGTSTNLRAFAKTGLGSQKDSWKTIQHQLDDRETAKAFESALDKLTVVDPTRHGPLYRHLDLGTDGLAEVLSRKEFIVSAPTSTGYVPDSNFGGTQLRFESADRAAALIGYNPAESEMLLLPGSRFEKIGEFYDPEREAFTFVFRSVPETSKSAPWGDLGHLSLGPFTLGAGVAAAQEAAAGEPVASEDHVGAEGAAAADASPKGAAFLAAAGLFNRSSARLVASAAKRLFSLTAEPTLKATARLAYSRAQIEARREELTQWHQNPEAPGGLIARIEEGLRDAPPEAFAAASAASYRALAFLRARLPQSGKPAPIAASRGIPVSSEAASKYARYEQAALYPGDAIREASEAGYLSPELLETLEELYPELLAELRVAAYQAVQDAGPRSLSIQAKTQYARLFDGDGSLADPTFSPQATMVYAAAYEAVAQMQPPKTGAGPRPGVSQTAAAVAPPRPWRSA